MYDFVLQTLIFLSLSVVIYLVARGVPRVSDEPAGAVHVPSSFDRLVSKLPLAKIDSIFNSFLEKFLRKIKVLIMKFDHLIGKWINKVKKPSEPVVPASIDSAATDKKDLFDQTKNIS